MRLFFSLILLFAFGTPAHAGWLRLESDHFIAYSDGKEVDLRDDVIRLEKFDALLRTRHSIPDDHGQVRLTVFFLRNMTSVRKVYGEKSPSLAGFYTASAEGALAVVPRVTASGKYELSGDIILFHEYAHHLMYKNFGAAFPAWYSEGFAEFLSTAVFGRDGKTKLGMPAMHRAYGLVLGANIPVTKLLTSDIDQLKKDELDPFYGRAWLLTHYLNFSKERSGQLATYLKLVGGGTQSLQAGTQAFGDLRMLEKDMGKYLDASKISILQILTPMPGPKSIVVTSLSPGEGEAMEFRIAMMRGTNVKEAEPQALAMRKIAAKYPADAAVLTLLSEAEHDASHWAESLAAANSALTLDPKASRAMLWKGEALFAQLLATKIDDAAKWKAARSWIVKANRLATEDATPLLLYYLSFAKEGQTAPDLAVEGMRKALDLVPSETNIRLIYVHALARQKKYEEAIMVAKVLANSPHGGPLVGYARDLTTRLEKAKKTGVFDEEPEPSLGTDTG